MMRAYELLAHLRYLTLTTTDGKMEWIGTRQDWQNVENEIWAYEMGR